MLHLISPAVRFNNFILVLLDLYKKITTICPREIQSSFGELSKYLARSFRYYYRWTRRFEFKDQIEFPLWKWLVFSLTSIQQPVLSAAVVRVLFHQSIQSVGFEREQRKINRTLIKIHQPARANRLLQASYWLTQRPSIIGALLFLSYTFYFIYWDQGKF